MRAAAWILLCLLGTVPLHADGEQAVVEVVQIVDGDTLQVLWDDRRETVRLFGVDAPENGQRYYTRAKELATGLAAGEMVQLTVAGRESSGTRLVRIQLPDSRELNQIMIRNGLAWWSEESGAADLERLEQTARDEGRGLWSDPNPHPPWEYRRALEASEAELIERYGEEEGSDTLEDSAFWAEQRERRLEAERRERERIRVVQDWHQRFQEDVLPVEDALNRVLQAQASFSGLGEACRELNLALIDFKRLDSASPPDRRLYASLHEVLGGFQHMVRACQQGEDALMREYYASATESLEEFSALLEYLSSPHEKR